MHSADESEDGISGAYRIDPTNWVARICSQLLVSCGLIAVFDSLRCSSVMLNEYFCCGLLRYSGLGCVACIGSVVVVMFHGLNRPRAHNPLLGKVDLGISLQFGLLFLCS